MGQQYTLYDFSPNKGAPIVFCVLFAVSTIFHIYQNFKYKCWKITYALPWGGLLFIAGFAMREVSVFNIHNLGDFIAYQVLLLLAPPVYSLTNYLVLGRALYYVPYLSPLHPGRVISTFVGIDVIVGILTGNGASEVNPSNSAKTQRIGRGLIRTSILLQVFSFLGFVTLTVIFHRRCLRANIFNSKLRAIIFLLYVSSVMISIRHIYRVVEVFEGYGGYVYAHEVFFYIFDATVMLLNAIMLNVFHPMAYLPRFNKTYLAKDGVTELEGPGWVDNRSFFITFLDPFDIGGLITGRDKKIDKFWETEELQHQDSLKAGKQVSVRGGQC